MRRFVNGASLAPKAGARVALAAVLAAALAAPGYAATFSSSYGWEDGVGTILSSFGNLVNEANVAGGSEVSNGVTITPSVTPFAGTRMLTMSEDPHDGTPQGYLAYIENLSPGDTVTASFWGWDSTPGDSPSQRIWGHYAENGDVDSYDGSASGNTTYTDGLGWSQVSHTWVIPVDKDALVVEGRLYSSPASSGGPSSYFLDNLYVEVTSASPTAQITTAGGTVVVPEPSSIVLGLMAAAGLGLAWMRKRRAA